MSKKKTSAAVNMGLPKSKTSLIADIKKFWPYYLMVMPGVLFFLLFKYSPMLKLRGIMIPLSAETSE
jgi:ABC-type polysaccharide transport system permease subunit